LAVFLARSTPEFLAVGVDVLVQEQVSIMLANIDMQPKQNAYLITGNSLQVLPKMVDQNMKFDLVLLDGDHNYHTVAHELKSIERLLHPHSAIVIDDYDGRWSERDLWYADRDGYQGNENVTKPIDTDKHGVKPAVDEWLAAHPEWHKMKPVPGEPVLLTRQNVQG
jgi:predicted O-methyltransferase YrrM